MRLKKCVEIVPNTAVGHIIFSPEMDFPGVSANRKKGYLIFFPHLPTFELDLILGLDQMHIVLDMTFLHNFTLKHFIQNISTLTRDRKVEETQNSSQMDEFVEELCAGGRIFLRIDSRGEQFPKSFEIEMKFRFKPTYLERMCNGNEVDLKLDKMAFLETEPTVGHLLALENDFRDFGVRITKNGVPIRVHKSILAAHSPVFKNMLINPMKEVLKGEMTIVDDDCPEVVEKALDFMYSGIIKLDSESGLPIQQILAGLISFAHKWQIPALRIETLKKARVLNKSGGLTSESRSEILRALAHIEEEFNILLELFYINRL